MSRNDVVHPSLRPSVLFKTVTKIFYYEEGMKLKLLTVIACKRPPPLCILFTRNTSWRRSVVVRTLVSAGELSLSCARLLAGSVTTLWLSRPLPVSQHGQLSHPSLRGR